MAMRKSGEGWWRGVLLLAGLMLMGPLPAHAVQTTAVQGVVTGANGSPAQGTVLVSWPSFTAADGSTVVAGSTSATIASDGSVTLALAPNEGAEPTGTYYTVVYHVSGPAVPKEYWVVPQAATVAIAQIRSRVVPAVLPQSSVSQQFVVSTENNLQTQLMQYVDTHAGSGTVTLPTGLVKGNGTAVASSANASDVASLFHSVQTTTPIYLQTNFTEGASGSNFIGTAPATCQNGCTGKWSTDESAVTAQFSSGGMTFTGYGAENAGGAAITVGHSDYTMRVSITTLGSNQRASIAIRRTDSNNAIVIAFNGVTSANIYDLVNGTLSGSLGFGNFNLQSLVITTAGNTITMGDGSSTPPLSVNVSDNLTGATIALTQDGGGTGATFAGLTVEGAPTATNVACAGFPNSDGTCSAGAASSATASDVSGHLAALPEIGTSTDASTGKVSIAWQEDFSTGKFDCRDTKYDGGCLGATPQQAMQDLRDDLICYESIVGKHPQVTFPNASIFVGTAAYPTLILPTGANYKGSLSMNGSGTSFQATYNNVRALQFNSGQSATCSDGHVHTAGLTGGSYEGFGESGCSQGNCVNVPGDSGAYPNGGPMQAGIFIGDSQGYVHLVAASSNGGDGLQIDGIDSTGDHLWGFNNMFWYYFGRTQTGQTYDPATDGIHGNVMLTSLDGQFDYVETYGTNNPVGNEYGHVVGILWSGGNSSLSHVFSQVDEIGVFRPYGATKGRMNTFRIEACRGECLLVGDGQNSFTNGQTTSACRDPYIKATLGHCDYIENAGASNYYGFVRTDNDGYFGTDYSSGSVYPHDPGTYIGMDLATYETPSGLVDGQNVSRTWASGYGPSTGALLDVGTYDHIEPLDTSATTVTGVTNEAIGQDVWVLMRVGGFDTLQSSTNGGHFHTCSAADVTQPGVYHFSVTGGGQYGNPAELQEQCDVPQNVTIRPVPATSTESCNDADFTFGPGPAKVGGFGIYRCHPANTWTFYPLNATSF